MEKKSVLGKIKIVCLVLLWIVPIIVSSILEFLIELLSEINEWINNLIYKKHGK